MTTSEIQQRIDKMKEHEDDIEALHKMEDKLREDFIKYIERNVPEQILF